MSTIHEALSDTPPDITAVADKMPVLAEQLTPIAARMNAQHSRLEEFPDIYIKSASLAT